MMKIAVFSTKPYNREFLASANDSVHAPRFFEPRLTNETVHSRPGFEAVCVFVNDHASRVTTPPRQLVPAALFCRSKIFM